MKKLLMNWYLWLTIGTLAIIIGAILDYRVYSDHKFNSVMTSLQSQEMRGTNNYVSFVNSNAQINAASSSQSSQLTALQKDVSNVQQVVTSSCNNQASDITNANLDSKVKHLWLSGNQKKYIDNAKVVLSDLSPSIYSNAGMCKQGELTAAVDENLLQLLPGSVTVAQLKNNPDAPSAQQISSLKKYTTAKVADYKDLRENEPDVASFYGYMNSMYATLYDELEANQAGNTSLATQYASKLNQIDSSFSATYNKFSGDEQAYSKKIYNSAITAATADISLIDSQKNNSEITAKLDYSVPVFWILDAKIGLYSITSKNNANPHATDISQLVSALHDSYLTSLYNRGLLQKASYSSLGANDSGAELSVTFANGSMLTEKAPPTQ